MTETDIKALKEGVTFEEIQRKVPHITKHSLAVPMASFAIRGNDKEECIMYFDERFGRLLFAAKGLAGESSGPEPLMLWPASWSGKTITEYLKAESTIHEPTKEISVHAK